MSTIQQVLIDANDSTKPLDSVLRSAMVLAYELDYEPLITWVNAELDGYETNEGLPDYRRFSSRIYANFLGPFHQSRNRETIPIGVFPEEWRDMFSSVQLLLGVRALEDTAGRDDVMQPLPDFIPQYLTDKASYGFVCQSAWLDIPPGAIAQILSAIRTRLLRFCLTLQREFPQLSQVDSSTPVVSVPPPAIAYYFNTIVLGQNASVALGGDVFTTHINHVTPGDFDSLSRSLIKIGADEGDIESLRNISSEISKNDFETDPSKIQRLRDWSTSLAGKIAGGIPADVRSYVVEAILKMIAAYYGITLP
jgi:hypothetical protein